ncbi:hypothetical protein OEZ86_003609 [Tetradesmus obliquus]|nr:hypothetical protein OEZ86_003609 [Tetradesmus obliquus]
MYADALGAAPGGSKTYIRVRIIELARIDNSEQKRRSEEQEPSKDRRLAPVVHKLNRCNHEATVCQPNDQHWQRLPLHCASKPGSCPGLGVPALLAGRQGFCAADELYQRQQGGCLSSSSAAARRLLASQADDREDVATWLEQQISLRQGARGASCNIDGPGTPEIAGVEVLGAAVWGCSNSRGLPRPAFQLLGLL